VILHRHAAGQHYAKVTAKRQHASHRLCDDLNFTMVWLEPLDVDSSTLPRLPSEVHPWLRALVILALLSFISSITLLALLTYRVLRWRIKAKRINQFAILILNLLWADTQQAIGFFLNVEWLRLDAIVVENPICAAQGWLISTGDLASGVWCFAIALHTFASVLFNYRLRNRYFYMTIVFLWLFIYGVSAIGMGRYSHHLYVRSGIWVSFAFPHGWSTRCVELGKTPR
jgi:hypothetical protein